MLTKEDGDRLLDLILAGDRLSNVAFNLSQEGRTNFDSDSAACRETYKLWDQRKREAAHVLQSLPRLPADFDPIALGC